MLSPYHNGGVEDYQVRFGGASGRMAEAAEKGMINSSVVMGIWWYYNDWLPQMEASLRFFRERRFDHFVVLYREPENIKSWSELAFGRSRVLGAICTPWQNDESGFCIMADHFWNTRNRLVY
jgi:hypothetical protein